MSGGESILAPGYSLRGRREYVVERHLDEGGLSNVYLVRGEEGAYAAKVLSPHRFLIDERTRRRFSREIELQREIRNRHVIAILDVAQLPDGSMVPIMEYAAAGNLREQARALRDTGGDLPLERVLCWATQMLKGLSALHEAQILHRDFSPRNVLFRERDILAIADFGVARRLHDETMTEPGDRFGSLIYISAQQRESPHDANFRDDIFSFGQVMFELVTGIIPHGNVGDTAQWREDCPSEVALWVDGMRAYERGKRPQHALAALDGLARAVRQVRTRSGQAQTRMGFDQSIASAESRQRESLERWGKARPDSMRLGSKVFEVLLKELGPFWIDPAAKTFAEMGTSGCLALEADVSYWDASEIRFTHLTNIWTGRSLLVEHNTMPWDAVKLEWLQDLFAVFDALAQPEKNDVIEIFTSRACGFDVDTCPRCGGRLKFRRFHSVPPYALTLRCIHCDRDGDAPRCGSCGQILGRIETKDLWGTVVATGCQSCLLVYDHADSTEQPWRTWSLHSH